MCSAFFAKFSIDGVIYEHATVSRHFCISFIYIYISLRDARHTEAQQAQPIAHLPFPSMPTHGSNTMDDAVLRVIARVEQAPTPRIKIGVSTPRGCSVPHNKIGGAPESKIGASTMIGCGSPHSVTGGAPQSDRRSVPHSKSGSISACLLLTVCFSWVHDTSVARVLVGSGQRLSVPYLHWRPDAPYLYRTAAAPFGWVTPFALCTAR
jgi:hypothetical protein